MIHVPPRADAARPLRVPALATLAGALLVLAGCGSMAVAGAQDGGGTGQGGGGAVDAGAFDGGGPGGGSDGGPAMDGGAFDGGGVTDGGGAGDGGGVVVDGGTLGDGGLTDGGVTDGGRGQPCTSDADCPAGQLCQSHCPVCDADAGPCPGPPCYLACTPAPNCGDLTCTPDQVCVVSEGGAVIADGGANVTYSCEAFPPQCQTVAPCDCVGHAICGAASQTDCSGSITVVTCQYP